ncbi:MAG TPA: zf-HC2 domain-containing protein [Gryllotalpicola sp.]
MNPAIHEWDAAYVLGALSSDDRRAFEGHLEECPECRASVAELAGMPALLARVPAADAFAMVDETDADRPAPPVELLGSLAHRVRRRRTARRWLAAGTGVLAAAAIAVAVVLPIRLSAPPAPTKQLTLAQTHPGALSATVALTAKRWGTGITMKCSYGSTPDSYTTMGHYGLWVRDAAGDATRVASWSAWPGATIHADGAVDLPESQLASVEVRDTSTGAVLLSSTLK